MPVAEAKWKEEVTITKGINFDTNFPDWCNTNGMETSKESL